MAIDMSAVRQYQRELNNAADDVEYTRRKINEYKELLDGAWHSSDVKGLDLILEGLAHRCSRLREDLADIGRDVVINGEEIQAEEEKEEDG